MSKLIYLDHAATTPLHPDVLENMMPYLTEQYANSSTLYSFGREAGAVVEDARGKVASLIGADPKEVYFTSGATESDNWAVISTALQHEKKGNHIITCAIEHHAVLETCEYLEKRGFELTVLPVDEHGLVDPDAVRGAITDKTILISIMQANNEIGTIEPIAEIGAIAREKGVLFHSDATQSVGKIPVDVDALNVDLLSLSAHKMYGPKGIGALYIRKGVRIQPYLHGGGQENRKRAGTHNVAGIAGLGKAAEMAQAGMAKESARLVGLRDWLIGQLTTRIENVRLNGHPTKRLPNNVNISVQGIEGESMILSLDMLGVCVSSGSACTSGDLSASHVLLGIGLPHELAHGSLRLTLGLATTREDLETVVEGLSGIVARLRAMSPMYGPGKME